jgi:two-component system, LytTR family, sensor kinase
MNQRWLYLVLGSAYAVFLFLFFFGEGDVLVRMLLAVGVAGAHAALYALNKELLLPRFWEARRYAAYSLSLLGVLLAYILLPITLMAVTGLLPPGLGAAPRLLPPPTTSMATMPPMRMPLPAPSPFSILTRIGSLHMFWLLAVLALSATDYHAQQRRAQERAAILHSKRILEADLGHLRAQVNPHFLMNALNNIYALSALQSREAPEAILNLSNMMQYVLYECSQPWTRLSREIDYLRHYIAFQCLRDESIAANLKVELPDSQDVQGELIPMALITFVENAFKHSHIEDAAQGWIAIRLRIVDDALHFHCSNSQPARPHQKAMLGGIGIDNVQQRLAHAYPGRHHLAIHPSADQFSIDLQIPIHHGHPLSDRG